VVDLGAGEIRRIAADIGNDEEDRHWSSEHQGRFSGGGGNSGDGWQIRIAQGTPPSLEYAQAGSSDDCVCGRPFASPIR
jgi:hypothetical protein